jgi:hypothetical protein
LALAEVKRSLALNEKLAETASFAVEVELWVSVTCPGPATYELEMFVYSQDSL